MSYKITREQGLKLLNEHVKNPNMIKYSLAAEVVMGALAAGKTITVLIHATSLIYPEKKDKQCKTKIHYQEDKGETPCKGGGDKDCHGM